MGDATTLRSGGFRCDPALADAVLARLGLPGGVPPTAEGLARLYRAFCTAVPFDNSGKLAAVATASRIPGAEPEDALVAWLRHGAGGTCWGLATALAALAEHCGLAAWCSLERLPAEQVDLHGTTVIDAAGDRWLCDPLWYSGRPLRLSGEGDRSNHPLFEARVHRDGHRWRHLVRSPRSGRVLDYRVLSLDLDPDDVAAIVEVTRTHSNINDHVQVTSVDDDVCLQARIVVGAGNATVRRWVVSAGEDERDVGIAEAFDQLGISAAWMEELRAAGVLGR